MNYVVGILMGYFIGGINPAYIIGRVKGQDIRNLGSHNAGASNTIIVFGKKFGVFVMLFDILKAAAVVFLVRYLFPESSYLPAAAGAACVLGHMFPCLMHFRGGKGFASIGGFILAIDWHIFLALLGLCLLVAFISDYVFIAALFASVAVPLSIGVVKQDWISAACFLPVTISMFFRHGENLKRWLKGEELGFSWLW